MMTYAKSFVALKRSPRKLFVENRVIEVSHNPLALRSEGNQNSEHGILWWSTVAVLLEHPILTHSAL